MNIYVGNLPRNVDEAKLRELFAQHGTVNNITIIMDRMTNMPRGFAFVDMPNDDEANLAIVQLNGFSLDGRPLTVNPARERDSQGGSRQGGGYSSRPRSTNGGGSRPSYGSKSSGPRSSSSRNSSWQR
jgi:RNA recognition motif-containing protein